MSIFGNHTYRMLIGILLLMSSIVGGVPAKVPLSLTISPEISLTVDPGYFISEERGSIMSMKENFAFRDSSCSVGRSSFAGDRDYLTSDATPEGMGVAFVFCFVTFLLYYTA